jgi:ribosomal protein L11
MLPPVGPFLGQHGFNTLNFCTTFNNMTKIYPEGLPIRVNIKLFTDKTLVFELKTPPTSFLLYSCYLSNNRKGVTLIDLLKITLIKRVDNNSLNNVSMLSSVVGTL